MIRGGPGNDNLRGWQGSDRIIGDAGNDILIGRDGGADRFIFHYPNEGIDEIRGFDSPLGDRIEVWKVGFGATSLSQFSLVNNTVYFDAKPNDAIAPVAFVRFEVYESPIPFVISRDIILF